MAPGPQAYDVVILGGALSGAATAVLLLRAQPGLRILIIEKSPAFGRRVGEATVEVSAFFLGRLLGLTQHLNEAHLAKQGMRFWFANAKTDELDDCSEIGGRYNVRIPAYQVDRSVLDEEVLRRAVNLGAVVWRPAKAGTVSLCSGGRQTVDVVRNGESLTVEARWVVDASGMAAVLARQEGWWEPNEAHPTAAVWARWTGVTDLDGWELAARHPDWARACHTIRGTATNHLVGDGWWAWVIPLKGGDHSVGVVYDQRRVEFPTDGPLGERLRQFLVQHPVGRELMARARWREGDVLARKNLAWRSSTFAGDGFVLVGDAAGFLDPFYSPGMDWIAYTTYSAADLILAERRGEQVSGRVGAHNAVFARSYDRWFDAVYRDKYDYLGDFELMRLAFVLDLGTYYLGVASQPFKFGARALLSPVFRQPVSAPAYHLMRTYNRRLAAIARNRRHRGNFGRHNHNHRCLVNGFTFSPISALLLVPAVLGWLRLELCEGWRTWFRRAPADRPRLRSWLEQRPAAAQP